MTKHRSMLAVLALVLLGSLAAVILTGVWQQTAGTIKINQRNFRLRALNEIVQPERYDNNLFDDTIEVRDPDLLGSTEPVTVYRARKNGQPVAIILTAHAPGGYSGLIKLLIGINSDGTLAGVRASEHHETAGLGDNIDIDKSDWILQFNQTGLGSPSIKFWAVKKDGGQFDQLTGATITPRAIVNAVRDALLYFENHRDALFSGPSQQ